MLQYINTEIPGQGISTRKHWKLERCSDRCSNHHFTVSKCLTQHHKRLSMPQPAPAWSPTGEADTHSVMNSTHVGAKALVSARVKDDIDGLGSHMQRSQSTLQSHPIKSRYRLSLVCTESARQLLLPALSQGPRERGRRATLLDLYRELGILLGGYAIPSSLPSDLTL